MKRAEMRKLARKHRGLAAEVARDLAISTTTVSKYLKGQVVSARIENALRQKLMEREAATLQAQAS